ncbi:MAG: trigger factor [Leptospirales bacterium]|nr:trigger factor [Leptospirales bacterium]
MKSTFISRDKNTVSFSMEFTSEEFENAVIDAYKVNKGKFTVDGFRKGKAPRRLIEFHYGEDVFFEEAINQIFSKNYSKALDELNIEVVDRPTADFSEVKKGEGFTITITVDVYPEFEVVDYKNVEIDKIDMEVSDEDVNKEIDALRKRNARMCLVDRPAKDGDMALIDYAGYVDGEQFEGGTAERYPLKLGSNTFIPGFEDQLKGVSAGEEREVKVMFPEDYHSADLAGKEAIFKCKIHEIKEEEFPELDDDFAKDVSEYDTFDELKKATEEKLKKASETAAENNMKNAIIEKIYNANDIDVPDAIVEDEIDNMLGEFEQQLRYQGMTLEKYFEYTQKNPAEFRGGLRDEALKRVKTRMIVSKIADQEKLVVPQEEIEQEIEMIAGHYKMELDKVKEMLGPEQSAFIEKDLKMKKAVDFVFENAKIK